MMADAERVRSALADRYAIQEELGSGGMATVYLAQDLKHDRKVAVKVLRPELAAVLGAERFVQEIKTTASLQHPHILPLHDSGEADGVLYYVMPFIDGETLRDKLNRETQLGIEEAVRITTEVADALDYAHRNNVIHRDIKPENILLQDGRPVVADFGIALAVSAAAGGRLTETGMSLGTPHYMSPEQATAEKDITRRSDIYSLASVLYEMLTGEPPHSGGSAQQIIMKIVTDEARPVTELRKSVPTNVAAAVAKALEKLPADRFDTAKAFAQVLADPGFTLPATAVQRGAVVVGDWRTRLGVPFAVLAAVLALVLVWMLRRPAPRLPVDRFAVTLPGAARGAAESDLALSADGSMMVYTGRGESPLGQLWLRRRNELHATPIEGSDGGRQPAISLDGRDVAFVRAGEMTTGNVLVAPVQGGTPRTVADAAIPLGLDWDRNGALYFWRPGGMSRVLPGGEEEVVTALDTEADGFGHGSMDVLPNANGAVFVIFRGTESIIAAVRFETGEVTELTRGLYPHYAVTGHLVWLTTSGTLMAAPFDVDELVVTGPAVQVLDDVQVSYTGSQQFAFSERGTLVYRTGGERGLSEPVWVDRSGTAQEIEEGWQINHPVGPAGGVALSPDGTRLAVAIRDERGTIDLWVKRLDAGPLTRMTFEGVVNARPFWLRDGRSIGFMSDRSGQFALWRKRADGSGAAELLLEREGEIAEASVTRDGDWLLYRTGSGLGNRDLYAVRLDADSVEVALAVSPAGERAPAVSPDGRWLAYVSDDSGREEVYVRPFPNVEDGRWQVSTAGGGEPLWAHSGRALFYRNAADELVVAEVTLQSTFGVVRQRALFSTARFESDIQHVLYDVTPDDQRFVMLRTTQSEGSGQVVWVQNWFEELKEKVER